MKNYSVSQVLSQLSGKVAAHGKTLMVEPNLGIHSWGKVDFLKQHGYRVIIKQENNN